MRSRESDRLWALAKYLGDCGFHVIRNPAPYALPSGDTLWYNNTIVQTDPDLVWLPQFAQPDGRFADTDEANRKIWRDLGFEVDPCCRLDGLRKFRGLDPLRNQRARATELGRHWRRYRPTIN